MRWNIIKCCFLPYQRGNLSQSNAKPVWHLNWIKDWKFCAVSYGFLSKIYLKLNIHHLNWSWKLKSWMKFGLTTAKWSLLCWFWIGFDFLMRLGFSIRLSFTFERYRDDRATIMHAHYYYYSSSHANTNTKNADIT